MALLFKLDPKPGVACVEPKVDVPVLAPNAGVLLLVVEPKAGVVEVLAAAPNAGVVLVFEDTPKAGVVEDGFEEAPLPKDNPEEPMVLFPKVCIED